MKVLLKTVLQAAATLAAAALVAACGSGGKTEPGIASVSSPVVLEGAAGSTTTAVFTVAMQYQSSGGAVVNFGTVNTGKAGGSTGSATGGTSCSTAGVDYITANGSVLVPAGTSSIDIAITICGDATYEPNETFQFSYNSLAGDGSVTAMIVNDDAGSGAVNGSGVVAGVTFGRDVNPLTNSDADGHLGFSYAAQATATGTCILDNVTGLLWEGKTSSAGIHSTATVAYSGLPAYVAAVNGQAHCGRSNWRLPTPEELSNLVDNSLVGGPPVDARFVNQLAARYWSFSTLQDGTALNAWAVDFNDGVPVFAAKTNAYQVRLVSSPDPAPTQAACGTADRYTNNGDLTITDKRTNLMWMQCPEGLSGATCTGGAALTLDWAGATARPAIVNADKAGLGLGYNDWRLPNRNELASLTDKEQCYSPSINTTFFPNNGGVSFWSLTPYASNTTFAWYVDFLDGGVAPGVKTGAGASAKRVRLVRAGQ